jgi:hypothetical protein
MPDAYLTLVDGSVAIVKGITATPTLVPQSIMDAYYRDDAGNDSFTSTNNITPVSTDAATGTFVPADWDTGGASEVQILSDPQMHIAPRQLEYELSYWQFTVGGVSFFWRWDVVSGWGTDPPPFF